MPRKLAPDVIAVAAGFALLVAITLLRVSASSAGPSFPSTYDTGRNGYAALYEFLARERVAVRRFESPVGELPGRGVALVIAGDGALDTVAQSDSALEALRSWIASGNTLYVLGNTGERARRTLSIPPLRENVKGASAAQAACGVSAPLQGAFVEGSFTDGFARGCVPKRRALLRARDYAPAVALRIGGGTLVAVTTPTVFDNWDLTRRANARFAYALFAGADAVAFDERPYGYVAGRTFWQVLAWPVRVAILIAAFALLLALVGANLPFAPPYARPQPGGADSGAYIRSLAQLLLRAGANGEIVRRLAAQSDALLRMRSRSDERSGQLRQRAHALKIIAQPAAADVLAAGELFAAVRKDYE